MTRAKKYIKVFVRFALYSAIPFGVLMSLKIGIVSGTLAGIMFGTVFGIVMSTIFLSFDYLATRGYPANALNVRQNREIQVKGDFEHIYDGSFRAVEGLKFIKKVSLHKEEMSISARTKSSLASYGEEVWLQFKIREKGMVEIKISSRPIGRFAMLDYGRNFRNVERIKQEILTLGGKSAAGLNN